MAYSGNRVGKKQYSSVRLTGLFKMKSGKGFVGTTRDEDMKALIAKIKEAMAAKKTLTFFVWKNQDGGLSLSADLSQDASERRPERPIAPDPFEDDNSGEDNDDPFNLG